MRRAFLYGASKPNSTDGHIDGSDGFDQEQPRKTSRKVSFGLCAFKRAAVVAAAAAAAATATASGSPKNNPRNVNVH